MRWTKNKSTVGPRSWFLQDGCIYLNGTMLARQESDAQAKQIVVDIEWALDTREGVLSLLVLGHRKAILTHGRGADVDGNLTPLWVPSTEESTKSILKTLPKNVQSKVVESEMPAPPRILMLYSNAGWGGCAIYEGERIAEWRAQTLDQTGKVAKTLRDLFPSRSNL